MSFQPSFAGPQPDSRIDRTTFIRRAYLHLAVAIVGFIVLSAAWSFIGVGSMRLMCCWLVEDIAGWLFSALLCWWECWQPVWRIMRGLIKRNLSGWGFMCWQNPDFCPLLTVAAYINPSSIGAAAITTLLLVGGLTFTAFP